MKEFAATDKGKSVAELSDDSGNACKEGVLVLRTILCPSDA
jgi:hypothetical protein